MTKRYSFEHSGLKPPWTIPDEGFTGHVADGLMKDYVAILVNYSRLPAVVHDE